MADESMHGPVAQPCATAIQSMPHPGIDGSEMLINLRPYGWQTWEYEGTRAQLEAEGVIPAGTEWPQHRNTAQWEDGRVRWSLSRTRPNGMKGPMRLWTTGD